MKLKTYILEIQNRLIIVIVALIICIITSYYYKETLLFLTVKNLTSLTKNNFFYFISTNVTEIFTTYFKLIYLSSFFLIINLILYHLLIFFKPALNYTEYSTVKNYFIKSTFFFYLYRDFDVFFMTFVSALENVRMHNFLRRFQFRAQNMGFEPI